MAQKQEQENFKALEGELKEFYDFHGVQLLSWGFPVSVKLLTDLHQKLKQKIFDAGEYFQILANEDLERYQVKSIKAQKKSENVFMIDHAVSFRYEQLREALQNDENLLFRLSNMTKYSDKKRKIEGVTPVPKSFDQIVEYDFMDIVNPNEKKVVQNCEALSFYGNNISDIELLKQTLQKLPDLKVLWVNDNPVCEDPNFVQVVEEEFPNIQILNSKYTKNIGEYGLKFTTFGMENLDKVQKIDNEQVKFLNLSDRNVLSIQNFSILGVKFPNLIELNLKDHDLPDLDTTNRFFDILKQCKKLENLHVDVAIEEILLSLYKQEKLQEICPTLQYVNGHDLALQTPPHVNEDKIRHVMTNIWKLVGCYRLATSKQYDESGIWYINDEFGSSIQHIDDANVKVAPFLYAPNNKMDDQTISYSICWCLKDIKEGEEIFRDFLTGITEQNQRSARLFTWFDLPKSYFNEQYNKIEKQKTEQYLKGQEKVQNFNEKLDKKEVITKKQLLCLDNTDILPHLDQDLFEYTEKLENADIVWFNAPIHDTFDQISDNQLVNQFPFESCIVKKNNLSKTVGDSLGNVNWIQTTYDLNTQLAEFIGDHAHRKENNLNNIWIIKPPNMARSMDMVVTDNAEVIIRLLETGPKLAQKYIERPLTLRGKKLDFRYIISVKSIKPLDIYIYKTFWIRTSNNKFTNDYRTREIYETHFTVMNYGKELEQIHDHQFLKDFESEYKDKVKWSQIEKKIHLLIKESFIAAQEQCPEMAKQNSRAIYGLDVMIDQNGFVPKLLEYTFSPDCNRACKYTPSFWKDIFGLLFLNQSEDDTRHTKII